MYKKQNKSIRKNCSFIVFTIAMLSFYLSGAQVVVNSLSELQNVIQSNNQTIVLTPGDYNINSLPSNSRFFHCTGSNNTIDLTGTYIEFPVGSSDDEHFLITGDNNTLKGGVFENTYSNGMTEVTDYVAYNNDRNNLASGADPHLVIQGDGNTVIDMKLTVRGSFPYGYGSMYGIGSSNVFGLDKRGGIAVQGTNVTIDGCEVQMRAFGHGIYIQSPSDNTIVRNTIVEGAVRSGSDVINETNQSSLPYMTNYLNYGDDFNNPTPIDPTKVFSLCEDGIRVYSNGGSVEIENCTVKKMRGGIRTYLASSSTVTNSNSIDCALSNFNLPNNGTITESSGNFSFGPIIDYGLTRSGHNIEMTILPSLSVEGPHNLADIAGNNHDIVFHRTPGPLDSNEERAIVIMGNNSTIINETEYKIILESSASGNTITSCGPVIDNGSNNNVTNSNDCEFDIATNCNTYTSDINPPSNLVDGVNYKYYEGTWNALPNFSTLTPLTTGVTSSFNLQEATSDNYFAFSFEGYINITSEDQYTFYTNSDDGSALWINDELVVDNDGLHGSNEESGTICLQEGYHKINVAYFEKTGGNTLIVSYEGADFSKTVMSDLYAEAETVSQEFPDPNKTYYIDSAIHNARIAATGESNDAYTTNEDTTGDDVEWKFVAKGNGYWHIQRAAGGSKPRLRRDNSSFADMQQTTSSGSWTYYEITTGYTADSYFLTLPDSPTTNNRLQINNSLEVKTVASANHNGTWESFKITEAGTITGSTVRLEAEDYDAMSGIQTETSTESGENVGWIQDGDWLRFDDVNLSGISNMDARVACNYTGGTIEVRTNSATGTLIGSITVNNTGGNQNWSTFNTDINNADGIQDVYLVFKGGNGYLYNVNWIEFNNISQKVIAPNKLDKNTLKLYPNPSINSFQIVDENGVNIESVKIYNVSGQLVKNFKKSSNTYPIDDLISGIYFIKTESVDGVLNINKLIKL